MPSIRVVRPSRAEPWDSETMVHPLRNQPHHLLMQGLDGCRRQFARSKTFKSPSIHINSMYRRTCPGSHETSWAKRRCCMAWHGRAWLSALAVQKFHLIHINSLKWVSCTNNAPGRVEERLISWRVLRRPFKFEFLTPLNKAGRSSSQ